MSTEINDVERGGEVAGRTLVLGDIHGAYKALVQVLDRCGFNRERDRLIFLGDVADGWPETCRCIDALLSIPNLVALIGNHDEWFREWAESYRAERAWLQQGGTATLESYSSPNQVPDSHRAYLKRAKLWYEEDGRMFVHGGWDWRVSPHPMGVPGSITWDRELWATARARRIGQITAFREVYIGHTDVTRFGSEGPMHCCEIWNMDTGAGWAGRLSIMDVETKEVWQSDLVADLYPQHSGRIRRAS